MNTNNTDLLQMTAEQQRLVIVMALRRRGDTIGLDAPIPFFSYDEQGKVMVSYER